MIDPFTPRATMCSRHEAGEEEAPPQVHRQHAVEVLHGHVQDRPFRDDPSVIEQDVAAAEAVGARLEERGAVALVAHVRAHGERLSARLLRDASRRVGAAVCQHIPEHHIRPVTGEGECASRADSLRRPADDGGLPLECDHVRAFLVRLTTSPATLGAVMSGVVMIPV